MCPQGLVGLRASPQCPPPPKFSCPVPRRWGPVAVLGAARRGLLCPERKVGAHFGGGHMGLSPLLPSRKAVGLPQRFRERPFPAGTSPRKTIPGREPRASTVLPGASPVGTGRECPRLGEPPQLHPMQRGDPCSCSRPQTREGGGGRKLGPTPHPAFLPFTGKSLQPSTPLFIGNPFPSILPQPCAEGRRLPPHPLHTGGYPASCPSPHTTHNLGGGTDHPPRAQLSYPSTLCCSRARSADSLTSTWRGGWVKSLFPTASSHTQLRNCPPRGSSILPPPPPSPAPGGSTPPAYPAGCQLPPKTKRGCSHREQRHRKRNGVQGGDTGHHQGCHEPP